MTYSRLDFTHIHASKIIRICCVIPASCKNIDMLFYTKWSGAQESLMHLNILLANQVLNFFVMAEHDNYHVSGMTKMQNNPQNWTRTPFVDQKNWKTKYYYFTMGIDVWYEFKKLIVSVLNKNITIDCKLLFFRDNVIPYY